MLAPKRRRQQKREKERKREERDFWVVLNGGCIRDFVQATFPVDADLSLKHPSMRRRATGSPHHHHSSGMRITAPETDDPITQRYILYHVCSRRLVRIFGGKIDARGRQETIYSKSSKVFVFR